MQAKLSVRGPARSYVQNRCLLRGAGSGLPGKVLREAATVANYWILAWMILRRRPDVVLMESNTEYLAAFWAWPHLLIAALTRTTYLANFHDPVRTPRLGPAWWHRVSLWLAFRPLRGGLVHGPVPEGAQIPPWVALREVPHGLFEEGAEAPPALDVRDRLGIGAERFVILAFGFIVDRKNLDLLMDAVAAVPDVDLVVAGQHVSATQRPVSFYREHAERRGVADRVHFVTAYIPEAEISAYFSASDAVALTYSSQFVSQSGVLQLAVASGRQVLASSGPGPLQIVIEAGPGLFVAPDDACALAQGIRRLVEGWRPDPAAVAAYRDAASWQPNIDGMLALVAELRTSGT